MSTPSRANRKEIEMMPRFDPIYHNPSWSLFKMFSILLQQFQIQNVAKNTKKLKVSTGKDFAIKNSN